MSADRLTYDGGINKAVDFDFNIIVDSLVDRLNSMVPDDIIEWSQSAIVMESTKVGQESGKLTLEPFQIAPIRAQVKRGIKEVVIVAPEQYGKSFCWRIPKVYQMRFVGGLFLIVYEEKDKARQINDREFHPLVNAVSELAEQFRTGEGKYTKTNYNMRDNIFEFCGAGADITSQRVKAAAGDEIDTWPLTYAKKIAQVDNLRKRLRRAMARGEGCLTLCSSAKGTTDNSVIWDCYEDTNQGIFNLRCMNCGGLTIPSTMIDGKRDPFTKKFHGGLKWETENFIVIPDSIRLECPDCKYQHNEIESMDMVHWGEYVFNRPDIWEKHGYLFGSLCSYKRSDGSWLALKWKDIAQKRVEAGRSNLYEVKRTYWNSFVGTPIPKKKNTEDSETAIGSHRSRFDNVKMGAIVGAADTQESPWGWFWIIRGIDAKWNTYLLDCGFAGTEEDLGDVIKRQYEGLPISLFIIDQGGTNAEGVKKLAKKHSNVWQYKGSSRPTELWSISKNKDQRKLINCDAGRLQTMILRLIYEQEDRSNNYWFLPTAERFEEWTEIADKEASERGYNASVFDYMEHIVSVQPTDGKDGEKYQFWNCKGHERRDYFDCEKMLLVLLGREQFRRKLQRLLDRLNKPKEEDSKGKGTKDTTNGKVNSWIGKARSSGGDFVGAAKR